MGPAVECISVRLMIENVRGNEEIRSTTGGVNLD